MGTQGPGRIRIQNRKQSAEEEEEEALLVIAREAEARLALRRAARAEAREIRMKELEKQQRELFQSHKKYYGLENKWGHIEQWMEDSERYSRHSRRHTSMSDDEERMSVGSRGSFRPSDYSSFLGSGSRASSRSSSARASPVVEERPERDFLDKACRTSSTLSPSTLASLGGASRRESCDTSVSVEMEASIRGLREALADSEEKFRRSMLSNAQLHNDKEALKYQVEALKEELDAMEEELWESRRQVEQRSKEFEQQRQSQDVLKVQLRDTRDSLKDTEQLLTEVSELRVKSTSYSQEVCDLQEVLQWKEKKMEVLERRSHLCDLLQVERDRLRDEVEQLIHLLKQHGVIISTNGEAGGGGAKRDDVSTGSATQLAEELSHDNRESMLELQQARLIKTQAETKRPQGEKEAELQNADRTVNALKFKLVKSEQEVTTLQQHVIRLEAQVSRYKVASEKSQSVEDELKVEKRRLQRELRSALHRLDEVEASNQHLLRRLEKMKASRPALLAQQ